MLEIKTALHNFAVSEQKQISNKIGLTRERVKITLPELCMGTYYLALFLKVLQGFVVTERKGETQSMKRTVDFEEGRAM